MHPRKQYEKWFTNYVTGIRDLKGWSSCKPFQNLHFWPKQRGSWLKTTGIELHISTPVNDQISSLNTGSVLQRSYPYNKTKVRENKKSREIPPAMPMTQQVLLYSINENLIQNTQPEEWSELTSKNQIYALFKAPRPSKIESYNRNLINSPKFLWKIKQIREVIKMQAIFN